MDLCTRKLIGLVGWVVGCVWMGSSIAATGYPGGGQIGLRSLDIPADVGVGWVSPRTLPRKPLAARFQQNEEKKRGEIIGERFRRARSPAKALGDVSQGQGQ